MSVYLYFLWLYFPLGSNEDPTFSLPQAWRRSCSWHHFFLSLCFPKTWADRGVPAREEGRKELAWEKGDSPVAQWGARGQTHFPAEPGEVTGFRGEWLGTSKRAEFCLLSIQAQWPQGSLQWPCVGQEGQLCQTGLKAVLPFLKT